MLTSMEMRTSNKRCNYSTGLYMSIPDLTFQWRLNVNSLPLCLSGGPSSTRAIKKKLKFQNRPLVVLVGVVVVVLRLVDLN